MLLHADDVRLSVGALVVSVSFGGHPVSRLVVTEPSLQPILADIVAEFAGQHLRWSELRVVLETRGVNVASLEAANPRRAPLAW